MHDAGMSFSMGLEPDTIESKEETEIVSDQLLTIPNVISTIRLCLVPLFFVLLLVGQDIAATVVFAVAALTDFIDGQVARRTHTVTKLGKLLDPAVDTALMIFGVIGCFIVGRLPLWIMLLIFLRELFLLVGGAILLKRFHIRVNVVYPGKVATTFLFFGIAALVLGYPELNGLGMVDAAWLPGLSSSLYPWGIWFVYIGLVLQIGVTVYYCIVAWRKLGDVQGKHR